MRLERERAVITAGLAWACLALLWQAVSAVAAEQEASEGRDEARGEILLSVREAGVLAPGQVEVGLLLDNYDRDPLGVDVVDGGFSFRIGVVQRLELRFDYQITRSVSTPGWHPVPSPPLDVVVLNGDVPVDPYRAMYWPMPFLSHESARVDEMVPGEYTIGARAHLFGQRGARPALSAGVQVTAPGTSARYDLSKGSGSGATDFGFQAAASWSRARLGVSTNLGLSVNGEVEPGDRFLVVGNESSVRDVVIRRPNFLNLGLGVRFRVWRGVSLVGEVAGWSPVGARTPMQGESGASELLGGVLLRLENATIAAGLRWHLNAQPHAATVATGPLAGALDLSGLPESERAHFVAGLAGATPRPDANLLVLGLPEGAPPPPGAVSLPASYRTSTLGNLGVALRVSFRVGRK